MNLHFRPKDYQLFQVMISKVENILNGSLDSLSSPSSSVKIQIMGGKVCLRCKEKTLLGIVNILLAIEKKFVDVIGYTSYLGHRYHHNVCSSEKLTKHSSNTVLRFVSFSAEKTLSRNYLMLISSI